MVIDWVGQSPIAWRSPKGVPSGPKIESLAEGASYCGYCGSVIVLVASRGGEVATTTEGKVGSVSCDSRLRFGGGGSERSSTAGTSSASAAARACSLLAASNWA